MSACIGHRAGAARNLALAAARGEWLAYLDADDEYDAGYLASVRRSAGLGDLLVHGYDTFDERPRSPNFGRVWGWDPAAHMGQFPEGPSFVPLAVTHRRDLPGLAGGFVEGTAAGEDLDLWRRLVAGGARPVAVSGRAGVYTPAGREPVADAEAAGDEGGDRSGVVQNFRCLRAIE